MSKLDVNFNNITGKIKAMHAVGQPPWLGINGSYLHYLTEAHIPYSRLHDMGGPYGGFVYVDIPNVFRNFDADENDPASYDFAFTDILVSKLVESGCMPYYRLGVTIENYVEVKSYRIDPPKDFNKWARICEHIIRHYREGWANGFNFDIVYWEVWNECDNEPDPKKNPMWNGTKEQYYQLYDVTAKHLKSCFGSSIKVGGYASSGLYSVLEDPKKYGIDLPPTVEDIPRYRNENFMAFFLGFIEYIKQNRSPIDFFSWHSYASIASTVTMERFVEKILNDNGYGDIEIHVNEWCNANKFELRGTSYASATLAEMMVKMQKTECDIMCYYDARIGASVYGGLFDPCYHKPLCTYYSIKAFGELYALGSEVECSCDGRLDVLGASDGNKKAVLLVNVNEEQTVECDLPNMRAFLIDQDNLFTPIAFDGKSVNLKKNQVVLIMD